MCYSLGALRTYGKSKIVRKVIAYLFVGSGMIEDIIESKIMRLNEFSQINFES